MAEPGRTEAPTAKRKEDARKKGQVSRSTDFNGAVILLTAALLLRWIAPGILDGLKATTKGYLSLLSSSAPTLAGTSTMALEVILQIFSGLAPFALSLLAMGLLANYLQIGFLFTFEPLTPKITNLNPANGFKRIFSRRSGVEFLKAILKVGIVGGVAFWTLSSQFNRLVPLLSHSIEDSVLTVAEIAFLLMIRIAVVLFVLGFFDLLYQRFEYLDGLKMTKQEVKDEYKQMEGDPLIRARIQRIRNEQARRRMITDIKEADVVVTNPTHYAVALRYSRGEDSAPVVLAKGARRLALKIREEAKRYRIPIVEDPPLAQTLFRSAEIGQPIPENLYSAVAEVLAHVYRAPEKEPSAGGGSSPYGAPEGAV